MKKSFIVIVIVLVLIITGSIIFANLVRNTFNPHLEGKSAPSPTIKLNGMNMEHTYESFCWNKDCSQMKHNPPSISFTKANKDDTIEIYWDKFKNKPNRVILHNITTGETIAYHLTDSDIEIDVPEQANPFQYEVIFQWYLGKSNDLRGESYLNFGINTQ